ncbi:MAG: LamG domain-containing protein, partial [Elusimicrobiota bacterium]
FTATKSWPILLSGTLTFSTFTLNNGGIFFNYGTVTQLPSLTMLNGSGVNNYGTMSCDGIYMYKSSFYEAGTLNVSTVTMGDSAIFTLAKAAQQDIWKLTMLSGSTMTHAANSTARSYVVNLNVGSDFDFQSGATMNLNYKGYAGGAGSTGDASPGYGPAGSGGYGKTGAGGSGGGGGGHGGRGGLGSGVGGGAGGSISDSLTNPIEPGSGGGGGYSSPGGAGGGAAVIAVAGTLTLNGSITATGAEGSNSQYPGGSGAGGTVNLSAGTLTGNGTVQVNGGNGLAYGGATGGSGAGGRIAVVANTADTFTGNYYMNPGSTGNQLGGTGTLAIKDPGTDSHLIISSGTITPGNYTDLPAGYISSFTAAKSWPILPNGTLTFSTFTLNNGGIFFNYGTVTQFPSLTMLSGSGVNNYGTMSCDSLYMYKSSFYEAGTLNVSTVTMADSAIFTLAKTTQQDIWKLTMLSGSTMTHAANSTARSYVVNLNVGSSFDFQSGATINLDGKGYAGGAGSAADASPGYGPAGSGGYGKTGGSGSGGGGGGHGGPGGLGSGAGGGAGGSSSDSLNDPTELGSGGGGGYNIAGGSGGGAALITVAGTLTLNGAITAAGVSGGNASYPGGAGAGGTVNIAADTLTGNGVIQVNGGNGSTYGGTTAGGGGGGRIATQVSTNTFTGTLTMTPGSGNVSGTVGTVFTRLDLANHAAGQLPNGLFGNKRLPLFRFQVTASSGAATVSRLVFQLSTVTALNGANFSEAGIYLDANSDGTLQASETTQVGGNGVADISGNAGTLTFSSPFNTVMGAVNYIVISTMASVPAVAAFTIGLSTMDMTVNNPSPPSPADKQAFKYGGCGLVVFRTLSADNVAAMQSTGTWYNSSTFSFTSSFPQAAYYRYVFDNSPTYASWLGTETQWLSSVSTINVQATAPGNDWYLHVMPYAPDDGFGTSRDIGPFYYEAIVPSTSNFATFNSTGGTMAEAQYIDLISNVTAQIKVQDSAYSGILVSTTYPAGLVGQWHMEESSGLVVLDASTQANHGRISTSTARTFGYLGGGALNFANNADSMTITPIALNGRPYTMQAWFKYPLPANAGGWNTLFRGLTADHMIIVQQSDKQLGLYDNGGTTFRGSGFLMSTLTDGWHHVAVVGSGTTSTYYIDGRQVGNVVPFKSNNSLTYIGACYGTCPGQQFGTVDEVRVYAVARSSAQIMDDYASDTLAAHNRTAAYSVLYSTTAGGIWNYVSTANVTMTGSNGSTALQSLTATGLNLAASTNTNTCAGQWPCGATNQIKFLITDVAGNLVSAGPYAIIVDASTQPYLVSPANTAAVSTTMPVMTWSTNTSGNHRIQLASDETFTSVLADSTTANAFYVSTNSLNHASTYYWRVQYYPAQT